MSDPARLTATDFGPNGAQVVWLFDSLRSLHTPDWERIGVNDIALNDSSRRDDLMNWMIDVAMRQVDWGPVAVTHGMEAVSVVLGDGLGKAQNDLHHSHPPGSPYPDMIVEAVSEAVARATAGLIMRPILSSDQLAAYWGALETAVHLLGFERGTSPAQS